MTKIRKKYIFEYFKDIQIYNSTCVEINDQI